MTRSQTKSHRHVLVHEPKLQRTGDGADQPRPKPFRSAKIRRRRKQEKNRDVKSNHKIDARTDEHRGIVEPVFKINGSEPAPLSETHEEQSQANNNAQAF